MCGREELLSPLQHLGTHLYEPVLSVAVREWRNGGDGLVDVVLSQGAGLLEACACEDNFAGLVEKDD